MFYFIIAILSAAKGRGYSSSWLSGEIVSTVDNVEEVATTISKEVQETQKLTQLAAAQRMNTDLRRAILRIIMSGEDYIDTFEKILKLD